MSVSQHPIALRLERQVGGATRLLATVMALPLVDGIFPALVVAGALSGPVGILETGLLIFGGSATAAVILAEMEGSRLQQATAVLLLGAVIVPVAVAEAALAETLATLLSFEVFHRFAGLVILAVAAKTASARVGEYLPSPGVIVGLGLLASLQPAGAELVVSPDPTTMLHAGAAAAVGVAFALGVVLGAPHLRGAVHLDRFRFGSAVALGMLALKILGLLPTTQPVALGVLAVTAVFAYDPAAGASGATRSPGAGAAPAATDGVASTATDGGDEGDSPNEEVDGDDDSDDVAVDLDDSGGTQESDSGNPLTAKVERPPWL